MQKTIFVLLSAVCMIIFAGGFYTLPAGPSLQSKDFREGPEIIIQIGDKSFTADLYDNASAHALLERLPLSLTMDELNGNEKYYYFSEEFPVSEERVEDIKAGDIMLYGPDCLVLFYESFPTSYSYTRIGCTEDITGLADALGSGSVQVVFRPG